MIPKSPRLTVWLLVALMCAAASGALLAQKGKTTYVVAFTIDLLLDGSQRAFSDGLGIYTDYRLTSGEITDVNYCVEAWTDSSGFSFLRLHRGIVGPDGSSTICEQAAPGARQRQYVLQVDNADACLELYTNGFADKSESGCLTSGYERPRIRLANLFANKPTKTPIAFITNHLPETGVSYEIKSERDADVYLVGGDTNKRLVTYQGEFRLYKFLPRVQAFPVGPAFRVPLQMTLQRIAVK